MNATQLDLFESTTPPCNWSDLKSAMQKAYRRNHGVLLKWAFDWYWGHEPKYVLWRAPIFAMEENWKFMLPLGRFLHQSEAKQSSKNPMIWHQIGDGLLALLLEGAGQVKNKDGDGLRITAYFSNQQRSKRAETSLLEAIEKKVPPQAFKSFLFAREVHRHVDEKRFVSKEHWAVVWDRVNEQASKPGYQELRDIVGAAYFRSKKGGMADDQAMCVCVALLAMDSFEFGLYGGFPNQHPKSELAKIVDTFKGEKMEKPPEYIYDGHTGLGKRMQGYLAKKFPYDKRVYDWVWFFNEGSLVNETESHSIWWDICKKVTVMTIGFKPEEADKVWKDMEPTILHKRNQFLNE